jgi:hypothetical protein
MHTPSVNRTTGAGKRARKGAIAIMALLIVVVMAILFQTYMTHVLSDMKTGGMFDKVAQYNGERQAIGNLVKEAVLQFYERPRVGQTVPAMNTLIDQYLNQMETGNVTYTVTNIDAFPANAPAAFWPTIPNSAAAGVDTAIGAFWLHSETVPGDLAKGRVARFFGDSNASVLAVLNTAKKDIFSVQVSRATGGNTDATFTFYLRMFQVPVTNFNLVSYAITDNAADIPNALPSLGGGINAGNLNVLALSKMNQNGINLAGTASATTYPYMYRELFSAAASVWEYAFYTNTTFNYIVTDVMNNANDMYMLMDPYAGTVYTQTGSGAAVVMHPQSDPNGLTGFDPEYKYNDGAGNVTTVDINGYRVTVSGGVNPQTGAVTGLLYNDGTPATDYNLDGAINHADVDARDGGPFHLPNELDWTFDLERIAPVTAGSTYRRIYVHLPDALGTIQRSQINMIDSVHGTVGALPVIICVEGWSRANTLITNPGAAIPANYQVYLDGDLTDQQVMIYSVGTNVLLANNCSMDGVLLFDDKIAGFSRNNHAFTFRGLFAWNGGMTAPNLVPSAISINEDHISVAPLPAGTVNQFRSLAPRFMLVDVRSETTLP